MNAASSATPMVGALGFPVRPAACPVLRSSFPPSTSALQPLRASHETTWHQVRKHIHPGRPRLIRLLRIVDRLDGLLPPGPGRVRPVSRVMPCQLLGNIHVLSFPSGVRLRRRGALPDYVPSCAFSWDIAGIMVSQQELLKPCSCRCF